MRRESTDSLLNLVDSFERNVAILNRLGEPTDAWSSILVFQMSSRLDAKTLREWENYLARDGNQDDEGKMPSFKDMTKFLQDHARVLQAITPHNQQQITQRHKATAYHIAPSSSSFNQKCQSCGQGHLLASCEQFRKLTPSDRLIFAKTNHLCLNCLKTTKHSCKDCLSSACRKCGRKHNTLLHLPPLEKTIPSQSVSNISSSSHPSSYAKPVPYSSMITKPESSPSSSSAVTHFVKSNTLSNPPEVLTARAHPEDDAVLLWTALVLFEDNKGTTHQARILLDSGSQCNFITDSMRKKLDLVTNSFPIEVASIGSSVTKVKYSVDAFVSSRSSPYRKQLSFLVLPSITRTLPSRVIKATHWKIPPFLRLADPTFNIPGPVDAILGSECFADILRYGKIKVSENDPVLQKTAFGWVVSGKCPHVIEPVSHQSFYLSRLDNLENLIGKFWDIENCSPPNNWSPVERECERHFVEHVSRNNEGRYVVMLPKQQEMLSQLKDNRYNAQRRFLCLERKLEANSELKQLYRDFIHEYLELGHMRPITSDEVDHTPQYFLPHHAVLRPDSSTTKLRTVFDASCKSQSGISLNDVLLPGPTIQDSLLSIVMRFRMHAYVVSADIAKMYRQIMVHPSDQPLQRIYWRDDKNSALQTYQLLTVTYGTNSASFLATRVLHQVTEDEGENFPLAVPVIRNDFYMDDLLTGDNDIQQLKLICKQTVAMLARAGLPLRKFSSNSQEVLNVFPVDMRETKTLLELDHDSSIKTLGLLWEPASDYISYKIPEWISVNLCTKRIILSRMSTHFDTLGLIAPVIVKAKILMQTIWKGEYS